MPKVPAGAYFDDDSDLVLAEVELGTAPAFPREFGDGICLTLPDFDEQPPDRTQPVFGFDDEPSDQVESISSPEQRTRRLVVEGFAREEVRCRLGHIGRHRGDDIEASTQSVRQTDQTVEFVDLH